MPTSRYVLALVTAALPAAVGCGVDVLPRIEPSTEPVALPESRRIFSINDTSRSFSAAHGRFLTVLDLVPERLGPGDQFQVIRVGSASFVPLRDVRVVHFPPPPSCASQVATDRMSWETCRRELAKCLKSSVQLQDSARVAIKEMSEPPTPEARGSDIWTALRYLSSLEQWPGETTVFIGSDLWQDAAGESTIQPPSETVGWTGFHVVVLGVPRFWDEPKVTQAWRDYFSRCGVATIQFVDAAQLSAYTLPISSSQVPKRVRNTLVPDSRAAGS